MKHLTLELKTTATDQGEFTAIAAAYSVDRDNERIVPGAFAKSIAQWQGSGKMIPLHWNHSGAAEDIIGTVDPASMRETDAGLEVSGQLDLGENDAAKHAWRLMKKAAVSLSFGFMPLKTAKAADGVVDISEIDLFEITITPTPANPDTRFLALKGIKASADEAVEALEAQIKAAQETLESLRATIDEKGQELPKSEEKSEEQSAVEEAPDEEPEAKSIAQDPLRKKGEEIAFQLTTAGVDLTRSPQPAPEPKPEPRPAADLQRESRETTLALLI